MNHQKPDQPMNRPHAPTHTNSENSERISVHEAVCAERYKRIDEALQRGEGNFKGIDTKFKGMQDQLEKSVKKVEYMLYVVAALVLLGPGVAAELIKKLFHV